MKSTPLAQSGSKAYLIGIKGVGMAALAEMLVLRGVRVSGSDTHERFFTEDTLQTMKIPYSESFDAENIPHDVDMVIYSTAYTSENNPEVAAALAMADRVLVLNYPEAIGKLSAEHLTLAVCGTHGKTTTSAMLAEVLRSLGEDPSAIIGSRILQWSGNALFGKGKFFVLEADEYQNKLKHYTPYGVILTSVDWDHPDFFPTEESYRQTFRDFVGRIPRQGALIWCGDSALVEQVAQPTQFHSLSYGFLPNNAVQITDWTIPTDRSTFLQSFGVSVEGSSLGQFDLRLPGRFNALNATAVIALCHWLKLDMDQVRQALRNFTGTARRFEYVGETKGILVYDDYAHHPEEVRATLKAFRELFPEKRIIALFHPHTFTRTKALFEEFSQSFDDTDVVGAIEIYGSAREEQGGISSRQLAEEINRFHPGRATYLATLDDALEFSRYTAQAGDIIVTLGAGNVWEVGRRFLHDKD